MVSNGYNYTISQLWEFEYYFFGNNAYYTIKSVKDSDLYLKYVNTNETYTITVDNTFDTENPSDDYLWKLTKIESCAFYNVYTIASKQDETKYLTNTNGYIDVITGVGTGRSQATRYWKFHDITIKSG